MYDLGSFIRMQKNGTNKLKKETNTKLYIENLYITYHHIKCNNRSRKLYILVPTYTSHFFAYFYKPHYIFW